MRLPAALAALGLIVAPAAALAQTPRAEATAWRAVDADTGTIRDIEGLEQLARDFPDSGSVRLRLLQPYLAAGEIEKVMATLEWLYDRGYLFSDVAQEQIPKLLAGVDPGRIAERLRAEAQVIAPSSVVASVPAEAGLVESVFAVQSDAHYAVVATSVSTKSVYFLTPDGEWEAQAVPRASDLSGIVSDPVRDVGWIASGNIDESEEAEPLFSGVIGLTGDIEESIYLPAPDGARVSDLHVTPTGTLYASDPIGGGIYRAAPGATALEEFVPPGTFRSPQGLTTSADGTRLYVSDYRYGIAVVDLESRGIDRLAFTGDSPTVLDGVDGMWRHGDELIVVQNGTSPMRIAAFRLSEDGLSVTGYRVLEQANPEWTEPLNGSLDGDALVYIGNGQWDRFVKGEPVPDKPVQPTQVRRLELAR